MEENKSENNLVNNGQNNNQKHPGNCQNTKCQFWQILPHHRLGKNWV